MSEKNATISAAVPAAVKSEAAAVAVAHGMSLAALVRELVARVGGGTRFVPQDTLSRTNDEPHEARNNRLVRRKGLKPSVICCSASQE